MEILSQVLKLLQVEKPEHIIGQLKELLRVSRAQDKLIYKLKKLLSQISSPQMF